MISALEAGFERAFATIVDSNATMAIAAVILFFLGSGPVRGFAIMLFFGIITTVVTAVTMTRMMIALWYRWAQAHAAAVLTGVRTMSLLRHRSRRHELRLHALPAHELPVLGLSSRWSLSRASSSCRTQLWHRLHGRHAHGDAGACWQGGYLRRARGRDGPRFGEVEVQEFGEQGRGFHPLRPSARRDAAGA